MTENVILTSLLAEQTPVAYEYVEHRPYGAPGEIKRGTILLEHYRRADGTIAGDWEWLIEQFKNAKTTISMRPLYAGPYIVGQEVAL